MLAVTFLRHVNTPTSSLEQCMKDAIAHSLKYRTALVSEYSQILNFMQMCFEPTERADFKRKGRLMYALNEILT